MKQHTMKLAAGPFGKIKSGKKIIESRLYDEKRQTIAVGDLIEFALNDEQKEKIVTQVEAIYRCTTFAGLISQHEPALFGGQNATEVLEEVQQFYSQEDQEKFGVIGIRIKLMY